jgi:hypothetical protein
LAGAIEAIVRITAAKRHRSAMVTAGLSDYARTLFH